MNIDIKWRRNEMYKLVVTISIFLRTFIFPNPFTGIFGLYLSDTMWGASAATFAEAFNFIFGGTILLPICYPLVGIIYTKGEAPIIGSILYALAVLFNSWLLSWLSTGLKIVAINQIIICFTVAIVIQIIALSTIRKLKEKVLHW